MVGLPVWCEDEAGPYQAIPQPGASWQPVGKAATQPHEFQRGGTAKLFTLLHPATGEVRGQAVQQTTNAILHPWLQDELRQIVAGASRDREEQATVADQDQRLEESPPCPDRIPVDATGQTTGEESALRGPEGEEKQTAACWTAWPAWRWTAERIAHYTDHPAPMVVLLLVLDNLAGHYSKAFVAWCLEQGVALLFTPLGGSCYNMAESVQRIFYQRAIAGQHYHQASDVMDALTAVLVGWNAHPTPFHWGGKRQERRRRAKERRHAVGGACTYTKQPVSRRNNHDQLAGNPDERDK